MEKSPPSTNITSQEEIKSTLIPDSNGNPGCSSSTNGNEAAPSVPGSSKAKTPPIPERVPSPSTSRKSPDPCCAICLEQLQNKSYTNGCLHMFCFKCLVDWSKIKPVCPLCKQEFKSIIYNVKEDCKYDTYYLNNRNPITTDNVWNFTQTHNGIANSTIRINTWSTIPRFRYRTTVTADRYVERNASHQNTWRIQIENHRRTFAPHSVSVISTTQAANPVPSRFRGRIYQQKLWVRPLQLNRFRIVSPEFFKRNPACTHRLLPWLNRELIVLLHNNESQISDVLELIMALITRYDITSPEFFRHIAPYLRERTAHFVHEFYNFASSPYNMEEYDEYATYDRNEPQPRNEVVNRDENEVMIVDPNESSNNERAARSKSENKQNVSKKTRSKGSSNKKNVEKVVLKRNRETDSWVTVMGPLPLMHDYSMTNMNNDYYSNPGPSNIPILTPSNLESVERPLISPVHIEIESSDDDEVEVLDVLKPKAERTPEIVDLSSDDEVSNVATVASSENNCLTSSCSRGTPNSQLPQHLSPVYSPVSPVYSPRIPSEAQSPASPPYSPNHAQEIFENSNSSNDNLNALTNSSLSLLRELSDSEDDCIYESSQINVSEEQTKKEGSSIANIRSDENNNANDLNATISSYSPLFPGTTISSYSPLSPTYNPFSPSVTQVSPSHSPNAVSNSFEKSNSGSPVSAHNDSTILLEVFSDTDDDCIYDSTHKNVPSVFGGSPDVNRYSPLSPCETISVLSPNSPVSRFSFSSDSDIECVFDSNKASENDRPNEPANHASENLPLDLSKLQESSSHNSTKSISRNKKLSKSDSRDSLDSTHSLSLPEDAKSPSDKHAPVDLSKKKIPVSKRKTELSSQIGAKYSLDEEKPFSKKSRSTSSKISKSTAPLTVDSKMPPEAEYATSVKPNKTYVPSKIVVPESSALNVDSISDSLKQDSFYGANKVSAENCSDTEVVQPPKKKKLRSVIAAHLTDYVIADKPTTHKSHKSRKGKKKKKGGRRIKRPVSDSDSDS